MLPCISPPELTELQLHTFLGGDAEPAVIEHLTACAHCRTRVRQLQIFENGLKQSVFRIDCPEPMDLGAYLADMLSDERRAAIQAHLALCPHCQHDLIEFGPDVSAVTPAYDTRPNLMGTLKVRLAQWVKDLGAENASSTSHLASRPVLAAIRGNESQALVFRDEAGIEISIELVNQHSKDRKGVGRKLMGLIAGKDDAFLIDLRRDGRVLILQDGHQIGTGPVDEIGNFEIFAPESGDFDLVVKANQTEIHLPTIHFAES